MKVIKVEFVRKSDSTLFFNVELRVGIFFKKNVVKEMYLDYDKYGYDPFPEFSDGSGCPYSICEAIQRLMVCEYEKQL